MNPYHIPGLENPYAPLCPYLNKDHHTFYVPVDDTEKEFIRFQNTMNSAGRLSGRGRLVVVTGESGCGKTSLINRCAAWLRDELVNAKLTGEILTLTDSGSLDQSIMLRMEQVLTDLVDNLSNEQSWVDAVHIDLLKKRIKEIEELKDTSDRQSRHVAKVNGVYKYLNDALPTGRIAIILLPPSSRLVDEIRYYAGFAKHPRIVFFAETDHVQDAERMWQTIPTNDLMTSTLLKVGPLNAGDSWTYAHARQGSTSADTNFPTVSEETMHSVTSAGVRSIRWLHKLLHGVYEELALQNTPEGLIPYREVSLDHIGGYFLRLMFGKSGNMS